MTFKLLLLVFLAWRTIDNWIIYLASKFVPYLGFFPYPYDLFDFKLDHVTSALANFDGIHYLLIAHREAYEQWEQAYFPLYPLLIRVFNFVFHNELITGLFISNIAFLIGLLILIKYLKSILANFNYFQLIIFILVFPTSFFFGAVYTEGLFFLLFVLTLYYLKKDLPVGKQENIYLAAFFAILASLTRLIGVFLIIPIIFHIIQKSHLRQSFDRQAKIKSQNLKLKLKKFLYLILNTKYSILILSPLIGLSFYCLYLWKTTGDPLMFLTSQPVFGANRSTNIILLPQVIWRYLKIFFTASHNFQYYVSLFEFITFLFVFFVLILDLFKNLKIKNWKLIRSLKLEIINYDLLALNLFSFANLILPTLTGTLSSIPRYVLFSLSFFIYLSKIKNKLFRTTIIFIFFILHILILSLFAQGYFVG